MEWIIWINSSPKLSLWAYNIVLYVLFLYLTKWSHKSYFSPSSSCQKFLYSVSLPILELHDYTEVCRIEDVFYLYCCNGIKLFLCCFYVHFLHKILETDLYSKTFSHIRVSVQKSAHACFCFLCVWWGEEERDEQKGGDGGA